MTRSTESWIWGLCTCSLFYVILQHIQIRIYYCKTEASWEQGAVFFIPTGGRNAFLSSVDRDSMQTPACCLTKSAQSFLFQPPGGFIICTLVLSAIIFKSNKISLRDAFQPAISCSNTCQFISFL